MNLSISTVYVHTIISIYVHTITHNCLLLFQFNTIQGIMIRNIILFGESTKYILTTKKHAHIRISTT